MKHFVSVFMLVTVTAPVLGCRGGDISSEGKFVRFVICTPIHSAPAGASGVIENGIRAIPSQSPTVKRVEWGRILQPVSGDSHCLLLTFNDLADSHDKGFLQALGAVGGGDKADGPYARLPSLEYLFHDATPQVLFSVHRHLRRVVLVPLKTETLPDEMRKLETAMLGLPKEISAIERFEWGTRVKYEPGKTIDPAHRDPTQDAFYCLVFTFKSTSARDACLSHPAYQRFQSELERHVQRTPSVLEYVAQVEYVAKVD